MMDEYKSLLDEQKQIQERGKEIQKRIIELRDFVAMSQDERCPYCKQPLITRQSWKAEYNGEYLVNGIWFSERVKYQIRLKVPKSKGGEVEFQNLVACCVDCGYRKGNKTHDEYLADVKWMVDHMPHTGAA